MRLLPWLAMGEGGRRPDEGFAPTSPLFTYIPIGVYSYLLPPLRGPAHDGELGTGQSRQACGSRANVVVVPGGFACDPWTLRSKRLQCPGTGFNSPSRRAHARRKVLPVPGAGQRYTYRWSLTRISYRSAGQRPRLPFRNRVCPGFGTKSPQLHMRCNRPGLTHA
jgi:hypothetical protein